MVNRGSDVSRHKGVPKNGWTETDLNVKSTTNLQVYSYHTYCKTAILSTVKRAFHLCKSSLDQYFLKGGSDKEHLYVDIQQALDIPREACLQPNVDQKSAHIPLVVTHVCTF